MNTDNDPRELARHLADELFERLLPHLGRPPEEYLNLHEVARRTGFSYDFVYDAVRSGDLPAVQKGRDWRVSLAEMRAWMDRDRAAAQTSRADFKKGPPPAPGREP